MNSLLRLLLLVCLEEVQYGEFVIGNFFFHMVEIVTKGINTYVLLFEVVRFTPDDKGKAYYVLDGHL